MNKLTRKLTEINHIRSQRGQSMVELALSFTMLMFMLSATVDIGRAFYAYIAIRDAAQEGAAYGSLNPTDVPGIATHVRYSSTDQFDLTAVSSVNLNVSWPDGAACAGKGLKVVVTYDLIFFMPIITTLVPSGKVLLTATMIDTLIAPPC